jgi:hypothetical protein
MINGRVKNLLPIGESGEILCRTMIEKREKISQIDCKFFPKNECGKSNG